MTVMKRRALSAEIKVNSNTKVYLILLLLSIVILHMSGIVNKTCLQERHHIQTRLLVRRSQLCKIWQDPL